MQSRQPKWNIHESVILLEAYLEVLRGESLKAQIIKRVSIDLRKMAKNNGMRIDDVFRNENGISYQLQSMDSAYKGYKVYVPATKLFIETVDIYRNDNEKYVTLCKEAKCMIAQQPGNKEKFIAWASSNLSEQRCKWIEENLHKVEQFATTTNIISCSLYDVTDPSLLITLQKALSKNKLFQLKHHKLLKNIMDDYHAYMLFCSKFLKNDESTNTASEVIDPNDSAEMGIETVLKKHYQYGFKYESIRELMRFRQFADTMSVILPDDDGQLKKGILSAGILIDDKVYCRSQIQTDELHDLVERIFSNGVNVIYYESLLEKNSDWMSSHAITNEETLKEYLRQNLKGCSFSKKFFLKGKKMTEKEAVTEEIIRVWGDKQTESVDNLQERLPYIPIGNIWRVISGNDVFVLASDARYLLLDRFIITDEEANNILTFVESACKTNGFASLNDVPLGDIEEQNYELSQIAILNAIYKRVLAKKYYLNSKILTRDQSDLDPVVLIKQYLSGKAECTFDEAADKVVELIGGNNRQYAFQALYSEMVRVDVNRFVSVDQVQFDVKEIDAVLASLIKNHFAAVRDIATFAMFPVCGQDWNHYLLESYCFKFSRQYSLHVLNFNDKNAGIIAEKGYSKGYYEMLAIALSRTNVELTKDVAGPYLCEAGYIAKSKFARLDEIVQMAEKLKEER